MVEACLPNISFELARKSRTTQLPSTRTREDILTRPRDRAEKLIHPLAHRQGPGLATFDAEAMFVPDVDGPSNKSDISPLEEYQFRTPEHGKSHERDKVFETDVIDYSD